MMKSLNLKKIIEICLVTDYVANGSFASLSQNVKYNYQKDYAVLVRTTDFTKKWAKDFVYVSEHAYKFLSKSKLVEGDIIISNVGEPGVTFRVPDLGQPMTLGPNAILVRTLDETIVMQDYLYHFFKSPHGQSLIESITTGTTQKKFNKTNFRQLDINIPSIEKQKEIIKLLDNTQSLIRNYISNINVQLENIQELEKSISTNAFTGKYE